MLDSSVMDMHYWRTFFDVLAQTKVTRRKKIEDGTEPTIEVFDSADGQTWQSAHIAPARRLNFGGQGYAEKIRLADLAALHRYVRIVFTLDTANLAEAEMMARVE